MKRILSALFLIPFLVLGSGGGPIPPAGGTGTVISVGLSDGSIAPIYTISGSPVTSTGTLTFSLSTETANTIFAGPTTGVAAQPGFRALVGADLPNPSATTLGGVESLAAVTHNFLTSISTSGVPTQAQPAFTDISGSVAAGQMPALTGDVTTSAGAVATSLVATTNATLATLSALTLAHAPDLASGSTVPTTVIIRGGASNSSSTAAGGNLLLTSGLSTGVGGGVGGDVYLAAGQSSASNNGIIHFSSTASNLSTTDIGTINTQTNVWTIGKASTTVQHIWNTATSAASNCGGAILTGSAGCITWTINGTTHYIPYY